MSLSHNGGGVQASPDGVPLVRAEPGDRVVTITLDSPADRNALSRRLVTALSAALSAAAADESVHAVLLTHTGPAFCSGAALGEMLAGDARQATHDLLALFRQLLLLPVPVVVRLDGATRAGGLGILGACDIVVASARSTFAFTEVRLGLAPAVISLPLRPLLTARAAWRYLLTGERFDAGTAQAIGLVTATADEVDDLVEKVLGSLRTADRQGLRETRPLTTRDRLHALETDGAAMTELSARLFDSPIAQGHMAAFLGPRHHQGRR